MVSDLAAGNPVLLEDLLVALPAFRLAGLFILDIREAVPPAGGLL